MKFRAAAIQQILLGSVAVSGLLLCASPAMARENVVKYSIPPQSMERALQDFGLQNGMTVMADAAIVRGKRSPGLSGSADPEAALRTLLRGTNLTFQRNGSVFVIKPVGNVNPAAAQAVQAPNDLEIVVTAQKREEKIIDVPIAMTALSADAMDDRKIEGGSELLRAIPNVNFSKSNFSMYNFAIRGIGTKSISASSDPAVAVSFNNTPLVRNRLFESEFFDLERVEVLRGPQGTLYGRNATAGVVNILPKLPSGEFEGSIKGEIGSYDTRRLNGMVNVPLSDMLGVRLAGSMTQRDGFDYNTETKNRVNGRDLWSARGIVNWEPSDSFRTNIIWQHFEEDDNRSRTGKALCTRDDGPTQISGINVPENLRGRFSQGCRPASLYDDDAFGAPNASGLAYIVAGTTVATMGSLPGSLVQQYGIKAGDPFRNVKQSRNLREIATSYDPVFRAKNDVVQFNMDLDVADGVKLISQTAYARDRYYSSQDFNRFVSAPVFNDSSGLVYSFTGELLDQTHAAPGGMFNDPQLGRSDRIISIDINRSRNRQWSQELRLQSSLDGPINFNIGANYLNFKSQDDYFVLNNIFTFLAYNVYGKDGAKYPECVPGTKTRDCVYVDPNALDAMNEMGHNYFLSRNIVQTKSWGLFGEAYWNVSDNVKLTAGVRWTHDTKISTPVPSQLLLGGAPAIGSSGGFVNAGYPADPDIKQTWSKPTGRLVVDWKPNVSFSDQTLVYASASRGYKGGGSNPPRPGLNPEIVQFQPLPATFEPEYVNAFEVGFKNSFNGGRFTLNATGFFYDYEGYQISQIVDRISLNENFDATSWGLEFETAWRPSRAFRADANLGFLKTRLKKGAQSIDVMNRTQGNEDWVLLRPWIQIPSNCIAPRKHVETILKSPLLSGLGLNALSALCGGSKGTGTFNPDVQGVRMDRFFGFTYNPLTDAPNGGRGFYADLEGNELPNAPRVTFNLGAQYTAFINNGDWELNLRGDYYRQSKSFSRVYNTEYDRLKGWDNVNLSISLLKPETGLEFQIYVKNLFDKTPITDTYTNSDDSGLSTNIFSLDPRIIGFNAKTLF